MRKWMWLVVGLVILVGAGYLAYQRFGSSDSTTATAEIYTVRRSAISTSVTASGSLAPAETRTVTWGASGEIAEVPVKAGDVVVPGQVLARLKSAALERDVDSARAALAAAETGLASAKASLADLEGGPSAADLETARIGLDQAKDRRWSAQIQRDATCGRYENKQAAKVDCESAEANVLVAESAVRLADLQYAEAVAGATDLELAAARDKVAQALSSLRGAEARVATAQTALDSASATTPISGTVTALTAAAGTVAKSGDPVAVVSDLGAFEVELKVGEMDVSQLAAGGAAEVTVDAFPDEVLAGEISEVAPAAELQSGVVLYPVTVRVVATDLPLKAGMSATVDMVTAAVTDALVVPVRAVTTVGDQSFVRRLPAEAAATLIADAMGDLAGAFQGRRAQGTFPAPRDRGTPPAGSSGMPAPPAAMGTAMAGGGTGAGAASGRSSRLATRSITVPLAQVESSLEDVPVVLGLATDALVQVVTGLSEGDRVAITTTQASGSSGSSNNNERRGGFGFDMPMGGPPGGPP